MNTMEAMNEKATAVMNILTDGLVEPGDHKKIDNAGKSIMPVSVECIEETKHGKIFSVTHYYEQEGDLMSDPDMTFLKVNDRYIPMTFQQDNLGKFDRAVWFEGEQGEVVKFHPKMQKDITAFANLWMKNIKEQQKL
jgi:hypothetical protein